MSRTRDIFIRAAMLFVLALVASFCVHAQQQAKAPQPKHRCSDAAATESQLATLLADGTDDGRKTPLILIHGIHGIERNDVVTERSNYWNELRALFRTDATKPSDRYALYLFQYCSDREPVQAIGRKLRDLIDAKLTDRNHVIVAHSMGGLVAKSYMAETTHLRGRWANRRSGETVNGLITLATPHHGTPGANMPETLGTNVRYDRLYRLALWTYWTYAAGRGHPSVGDSKIVNRSDLRWDNFDFKLEQSSSDLNADLAKRNKLFEPFSPKLIAYGGILDTKVRVLEIAGFLQELADLDEQIETRRFAIDKHRLLTLANIGIVFGLDRNFGDADGFVPFYSSLNCLSRQILTSTTSAIPANYICPTAVRLRRFEPGGEGEESDRAKYPDTNTLSIFRTQRGFDHLDMFTHRAVLQYVVKDLMAMPRPGGDSPVSIPPIPTLFLFDVSGSMSENDKIGQARAAGLDALREMRDEGAANSPVAVMTFAGDCSPSSTRRLMSFAPSLSNAENVISRLLPSPDGATPLPQAKDAAFGEMTRFLDANPSMKEGRVILLSDGQSTCGEIRPPGIFSRQSIAVQRRPQTRVRYFTIGFDVPAGSVAERDLQYLATETGGKYYNAANREQLIRSLQKQVRVFTPRACNSTDADFARGLAAFRDHDYIAALEAFRKYTTVTPGDWCGFYNLGLAYEANDRYRKAALSFRKYLELAPRSPDRAKVEQRIDRLRQDYADYYGYMVNLIDSDVVYLKNYYQSIFNRSSTDLAREFSGFVFEKRDFYAMLPDILEIEERWLSNDAKDIASSIDVLARRRDLANFDSDAVSLLTLPIAQIQDLGERLRRHQPVNF